MKLGQYITNQSDYIKQGIWQETLENLPKKKAFLIKQLRVILLAIRGFNEDKCMDKASSLTYYSLLSIVPVFAMMFGIAKGFGFEQKMEDHLYATMHDKKVILDQIFEFTHRMLENTQGGLIAGAGLVMLLWSVMKLLGNIETSFNEIWEVAKNRSFIRKMSDYFSIMLLAPILIILSKSATTLITSYIHSLQDHIVWLNYFGWIISILMKIIPWSLVWFAFSIIYMLMPNTKVFFRSAFVGGVIGGIIFQIVQFLYIKFQVGVASYNAIYGSFAAFPLFLVWLQTSWVIVLLGAEVAFASQNANKYEFELATKNISNDFRFKLSLLVTHHIATRFENEKPPITASELATNLGLPKRVLNNIVQGLSDASIVTFTSTDDEKEDGIQIAIPLSKLTINKVFRMLHLKGINNLEIDINSTYHSVAEKVDRLFESFEESSYNMPLVRL